MGNEENSFKNPTMESPELSVLSNSDDATVRDRPAVSQVLSSLSSNENGLDGDFRNVTSGTPMTSSDEDSIRDLTSSAATRPADAAQHHHSPNGADHDGLTMVSPSAPIPYNNISESRGHISTIDTKRSVNDVKDSLPPLSVAASIPATLAVSTSDAPSPSASGGQPCNGKGTETNDVGPGNTTDGEFCTVPNYTVSPIPSKRDSFNGLEELTILEGEAVTPNDDESPEGHSLDKSMTTFDDRPEEEGMLHARGRALVRNDKVSYKAGGSMVAQEASKGVQTHDRNTSGNNSTMLQDADVSQRQDSSAASTIGPTASSDETMLTNDSTAHPKAVYSNNAVHSSDDSMVLFSEGSANSPPAADPIVSEEMPPSNEKEPHDDDAMMATGTSTPLAQKRTGKDYTTDRYKVNGIIRRPCICANSDECRTIMTFWCASVDDEGTCRDPCRAGYIRLPVYQPNAKSPTQQYKNCLRLSFLGHLRPAGSSPSARWLATTRRQGKNTGTSLLALLINNIILYCTLSKSHFSLIVATAEYVALHHFPRDFLKKDGKGLKIEYLDKEMAKTYKLTKNDKIDVAMHPYSNQYFAPPCYKWSDLLGEYMKAAAVTGISSGLEIDDSALVRESTRTSKPKILCLGMSKPCVESQMDVEGYYWDILDNTSPTVKQAEELVRRNILTAMDARDLARCRAMENRHKVEAYTVSQETGAQYERTHHLHANFNRANFCQALEKHFDKPTFRQIILDYFWIPSGTWMTHHWSKSFFHTTLPNFVKKGMLEFPPESQYGMTQSPTHRKLGFGVVYLPFCVHCVKQLIASIDEIKQYYKITFLYKKELEEHALWSGTSTIDARIMQGIFGKNIAQEEIYCTFAPRDVFESMEDIHITQDEVVNVLRGIEDFADVRMIRLTPLSKHNPRYKRTKRCDDEVGGFVGLLPPEEVQRGFDSLLPSSKVTESSSEEDEDEEESSSSEEETEVAPPPPLRKKAMIQRKRQAMPTEALSAQPVVEQQKKRKRMFEVLPDLATYCSIGLEGNEDVADYYAIPVRKMRRRHCDISTYHFGPEPPPNADPVEVQPQPSLVSKLTLSFLSGYDVEGFRQGRQPVVIDDVSSNDPVLAQDATSPEAPHDLAPNEAHGYLSMLASVNEARSMALETATDKASRGLGYLMMLAYTADLPGVQHRWNDRGSAIESYSTILSQTKAPSPSLEWQHKHSQKT